MDGARRHDDPAPDGAPPPEVVHRVHDRFLIEVVERLGLCPFARHSREHGRVHRPLLYGDVTPKDTAARLHALVAAHPDTEIMLPTFVAVTPQPRWARARQLDDFVNAVREHYVALGGPMFFMVGFHPRSGEVDLGDTPPRLTADSLVPKLRRTPDPVIQCIAAAELERARAQAQRAYRARLIEREQNPIIRKMLEDTIMTDSTLSADIAKHNFEAVAQGQGRETLEGTIADIQRERDEAYAPYWSATSSE